MRFRVLLGFLLSLGITGSALTPSSFLSTVDQQRLLKVFTESLGKSDLTSLAFAVLGYKLLGESVPNAEALCQKLQKFADAADASVGNAYLSAVAAKELPGCKLKLGAKASDVVTATLTSDGSVGNLYRAALTKLSLGQTIDKTSVGQLLSAALKKDDGVANLGYAFNLASELDATSEVKAIFERVEDAVVQADEVDGKVLQFEDGLSVTHLVVNGAYKLAEKVGKAPPISKMQAVKFANYFLSRKSVQQSKGAHNLLLTLTTLSANRFHVPVSVNLASPRSNVVSESNPKVQVRVTGLLGKSLGKMDVSIESAMRVSDGAVIMSKGKMTQVSGDDTLYEVDVFKAKPGRGFYELTVHANPAKADERLVGNSGAVLTFKVLSEIAVENVEFGIGDSSHSVPPKLDQLQFPSKFGKVLKADDHHRILLKFNVVDKADREKIKVHQAFVSLRHAAAGSEIVFVAEADEADQSTYRFEMDIGKELSSASGKYALVLMLGDSVVSNPISWNFADVELTFPVDAAAVDDTKEKNKAKPEIKHTFREPEKRPAAVISNGFTVLCLLPFALLFVGWAMLGVNVSNFPPSISAIGFHLGLGAIFTLYYYFWLHLNMFTTVKYLFMMGVVTFLCGNSVLSKIAANRKAA